MIATADVITEFQGEMAATRRSIVRIPADNLQWQPHQRSMTIGRIGTHLAELPGFIGTVFSSESLEMQPDGSPRPQPTLTSLVDILELFDRSVAAATTVMAAASDADWAAPWTLLASGRTVFRMPRHAVVRGAIKHVIHHRGQLTVYLRMNDVPVPALYGPSADE